MNKSSIPAVNTIMGIGCLGIDRLHLGMVGMHGKIVLILRLKILIS